MRRARWFHAAIVLGLATLPVPVSRAGDGQKTYENSLTPIKDPKPLLADFPEFVEPIRETARLEAPVLVDDPGAELDVRAWRFSYNARAIIEVPNRLRLDRTAIIVVHPWGIDDGQGWNSPEPAGVAFQCTPAKNRIVIDHGAKVINPFLKEWRGKVKLVAFSAPYKEDPIRKKIYRSFRNQPTEAERKEGLKELDDKLKSFLYRGQPLPKFIAVDAERPTIDYFKAFPGLDATAKYNSVGFWDLPIPVMKSIDIALSDVAIYDAEGYAPLRAYLKEQGIRHVLLAGYNTDMCVCSTTAGYQNLSKDFDVFLVGDATIATFPANPTPRHATTTAVSFAALNLFITQTSWVKARP